MILCIFVLLIAKKQRRNKNFEKLLTKKEKCLIIDSCESKCSTYLRTVQFTIFHRQNIKIAVVTPLVKNQLLFYISAKAHQHYFLLKKPRG